MLLGRISERGGARSHWWVRSPDGDVWEEDMSGTDPGVGLSGSSRLQDADADDGRRYGFRALSSNRELARFDIRGLCICSGQRAPSIAEPANFVFPGGVMQPYRLSFPLEHFRVSKKRNEPWLLAEPLVVMGHR